MGKTIRMLTSVAGTEYAFASGQVVETTDEIAADLIRGGHAVAATKTADAAERAFSKTAVKAEKR